jgi:hypothetical protein
VDQALGLPDLDAHYQIDITSLNIDIGHVEAREVITVVAFRSGVPDTLFLQVVPAYDGFFTLDSLTTQGQPMTPEVLNDGVTLAIPLPAQPQAPFEIALAFHLDVGTEASGWGTTSMDGQVLRMGNWFPIISTSHPFSATLDPSYTASASFDVTAVFPADVQFAHTGEITQRVQTDDGQVQYVMRAEHVRDFAMALSRAYDVDQTTSASGVLIELYSVDTDAATKASVLSWAVDAVDRLSELIGPYPYASYRIADAGPSMPGGVEFPGMIYYNPAYSELDRLIYHETAHQWLYGIIGNRTLQDGWIDEGGAEFFERGLASGFTEIPSPPEGGYRYPVDATAAEMQGDTSRQPYYSIYEQGARLWYAVLDTMGPDAFWASMRDLYDQHRFGIVTAWDVLVTWQRHSAVDLRPLFGDTFRYTWIDQLPPPGGS